jgi:hypothetical protein
MRYFRLLPGSPAIDAGMTIEGSVLKDFNGTPVPVNGQTDIGAFEFAQ